MFLLIFILVKSSSSPHGGKNGDTAEKILVFFSVKPKSQKFQAVR